MRERLQELTLEKQSLITSSIDEAIRMADNALQVYGDKKEFSDLKIQLLNIKTGYEKDNSLENLKKIYTELGKLQRDLKITIEQQKINDTKDLKAAQSKYDASKVKTSVSEAEEKVRIKKNEIARIRDEADKLIKTGDPVKIAEGNKLKESVLSKVSEELDANAEFMKIANKVLSDLAKNNPENIDTKPLSEFLTIMRSTGSADILLKHSSLHTDRMNELPILFSDLEQLDKSANLLNQIPIPIQERYEKLKTTLNSGNMSQSLKNAMEGMDSLLKNISKDPSNISEHTKKIDERLSELESYVNRDRAQNTEKAKQVNEQKSQEITEPQYEASVRETLQKEHKKINLEITANLVSGKSIIEKFIRENKANRDISEKWREWKEKHTNPTTKDEVIAARRDLTSILKDIIANKNKILPDTEEKLREAKTELKQSQFGKEIQAKLDAIKKEQTDKRSKEFESIKHMENELKQQEKEGKDVTEGLKELKQRKEQYRNVQSEGGASEEEYMKIAAKLRGSRENEPGYHVAYDSYIRLQQKITSSKEIIKECQSNIAPTGDQGDNLNKISKYYLWKKNLEVLNGFFHKIPADIEKRYKRLFPYLEKCPDPHGISEKSSNFERQCSLLAIDHSKFADLLRSELDLNKTEVRKEFFKSLDTTLSTLEARVSIILEDKQNDQEQVVQDLREVRLQQDTRELKKYEGVKGAIKQTIHPDRYEKAKTRLEKIEEVRGQASKHVDSAVGVIAQSSPEERRQTAEKAAAQSQSSQATSQQEQPSGPKRGPGG